ncbi:MAG: UDP-N-acetylmuramate--L-alanine ligase [Phycisphaeraceae bacterium]
MASPLACDETGRIQLAGRRVHFVGIGGSGMSGLARMVQHHGAVCTGSDLADGPPIDALRGDGFGVVLEQTAASVPADCDLLVASAAIQSDHPELAEAQRRGITVLKYAPMLGALMRGRTGVAVAGTHGKSTTTSILSYILIQAGLDPSFIVGATCEQIGGGSRTGASNILVAEACEYDRSFHHLHPTHAIILNVEEDHLDCYGSLDAIVESFATFAQRLPREGSLLINHDTPHRLTITAGLNCAVETIGFAPQADWRVEVVRPVNARPERSEGRDHRAVSHTRLLHRNGLVCEWANPLPGEHMAYNAAAAAITAHRLGAAWDDIAVAIAGFRGLDRRMQLMGKKWPSGQVTEWSSEQIAPATHSTTGPLGHSATSADPITVIDDYGHHPTEVDTTLRALNQHYDPQRLVCVFQPHQHSRTRFLMEAFATSFSEADIVIVPHIYFVRDSEKERHAVTAGDLVDRLRERGVTAMHLYPFEAIVEQLQVITQGGDLVVTMGAGDVWKIARAFLDT